MVKITVKSYSRENAGKTGEAELKQFTRGSLAVGRKSSDLEKKIFSVFVRGVNVKKISQSLNKPPQEVFDVVRRVGMEYQTVYKKAVNGGQIDGDKRVFADFVRGEDIQTLVEKNNAEPTAVFDAIRDVGKIYEFYSKKEKK